MVSGESFSCLFLNNKIFLLKLASESINIERPIHEEYVLKNVKIS